LFSYIEFETRLTMMEVMKIVKRISIFIFCFLPGLIHSQYTYDILSNERLYLLEWKYNNGDHPDWVKPEFDDTEWEICYPHPALGDQQGIYYYRCTIRIENNPSDSHLLAMKVLNLGNAFEIYWDGVLIKQNGRVGTNKETEHPGNHFFVTKLNKEWITSGLHFLTIRCSNLHGRSGFLETRIAVDSWEKWHSYKGFMLRYTIFISGILMTVAILSIALYIGLYRKKNFLVLMAFALFSLILIYINYRDITGIPTTYDFFYIAQNILYYFVNILLVGYFIIFLGIRDKIIHFSFISLILVLDPFLTFVLSVDVNLLLTWLFLLYTSAILIYAMKRKISGSVILFTGFVVSASPEFLNMLPVRLSIRQHVIFGSFTSVFLLFCMLVAICRRLVEQTKQHEEALAKAHRIENEMLKKTIQPHFIMNTLLSLMHLILKDSRKAIQLVQLLAEEFKLINLFSSKKLIPVEEEIKLCKIHLDLMSLRKKTQYELNTKNIEPLDMIPPMIFHTLIENGLTHAFKTDENGSFELSSQKDDNSRRYILTNNGSKLEELENQTRSEINEGLGIHYVKARLEESFGNEWKLKYGLKNNHWKVEISIKN